MGKSYYCVNADIHRDELLVLRPGLRIVQKVQFLSAPGDILFEIDNRKITSAAKLARYVQQTRPGSMLAINFLRHNSPYLAHVRAGEKKLFQNSYEIKAIYPSQNDMVTDSILKEITNLKQILKLLENRLKQLR